MTVPKGLFRRFIVLGLLLVAFSLSRLDDQPTQVFASACCEDCDEGYGQCLNVCSQFQNPSDQSDCATLCNQSNRQCVRHCIVCGAGTGATYCDFIQYRTPTGSWCEQGFCSGAQNIGFQISGCNF